MGDSATADPVTARPADSATVDPATDPPTDPATDPATDPPTDPPTYQPDRWSGFGDRWTFGCAPNRGTVS